MDELLKSLAIPLVGILFWALLGFIIRKTAKTNQPWEEFVQSKGLWRFMNGLAFLYLGIIILFVGALIYGLTAA